MHRTLTLLMLGLVLGTLAGSGAAYWRFGGPRPRYLFSKPLPTRGTQPATITAANRRPKVVVEGNATYDFGVMSRNERRSHVFVVSNKGDAVLEINYVDKSCQCTDVVIQRSQVPPGEHTEIELTWQPTSFNPLFEQSARFSTNDPGRIELDLTIRGKVQQLMKLQPAAVTFDSVTRGQLREVTCQLFSYHHKDLAIADAQLLVDETAEHFEVVIEPMPEPMLQRETGALSGRLVKIRMQPGTAMPVGRFQQRVRLELQPSELGIREIPILGSVVGSISVFGQGYQQQKQVWALDMLSGDQTHERKLWIVVRGKPDQPVEMRVASTDPAEVLQATIEPPVRQGKLARHTLTLKITPTGATVNRLGNQPGEIGEIVIETSLPEQPEIRIPVAFGIESNLE